MTRKFMNAGLGGLIGILGLIASFTAAFAEDYIVVNLEQVYAETKAGKDVARQVNEFQEEMIAKSNIQQMGEEFQNTRGKLQQFQQNLEQKLITQEVFDNEIRKALQQERDFNAMRGQLQQAMSVANQNALIQFINAIQPMLKEVVDDNDAKILFKRDQVLFFDDDVDVTKDTIKLVDRRLDALPVTLIPEQPEQQAAQ